MPWQYVVVTNEGNIAAEAGVKDGVSYVETNSLGTVTKQLIALEDLKPFQATEKSMYSFYLCFVSFNSEKYFNFSLRNSGSDD